MKLVENSIMSSQANANCHIYFLFCWKVKFHKVQYRTLCLNLKERQGCKITLVECACVVSVDCHYCQYCHSWRFGFRHCVLLLLIPPIFHQKILIKYLKLFNTRSVLYFIVAFGFLFIDDVPTLSTLCSGLITAIVFVIVLCFVSLARVFMEAC